METYHVIICTVFFSELGVIGVEGSGLFLQSGNGHGLIICIRMELTFCAFSDSDSDFFFLNIDNDAAGQKNCCQGKQDNNANNFLLHCTSSSKWWRALPLQNNIYFTRVTAMVFVHKYYIIFKV